MKALILTIGKATEPSIIRINKLKPNFVYFIHSTKSKENALFIIEETGIRNYDFKKLDDHESVDDAFIKSLECINELEKNDYEIIGDFTVGTKPMVAGLVMACIEKNCEYVYLGESDEDSRHDGMGPVKSGQEKTKNQENPYENYAINEFKSGKEFFDKYQFIAAYENFSNAMSKLKYSELKKRSEIFMKIVEFYEKWDKFNDEINEISLNKYLNELIDEITSDESLNQYFENEIPHFLKQLKNNLNFLNKKLSGKTSDNIIYYLPDLLNNAQRRISEGKFDDAVARLYRAMELISQIRLNQYNFMNKSQINSDKTFQVDKNKLKKKLSKSSLAEISNWNPSGWNYDNVNFLDLDSGNNYKLLNIVSKENKYDLSVSTKKLVSNYYKINPRVQMRNKSILAHGLRPLKKKEAENLLKLVINHSKKLCKNIDKEMENAKFPLFEGD